MSNTSFIANVKAVFHFSRIVAKRRVFDCFVNTQAGLMYGHNGIPTFRYDTVEVENGLNRLIRSLRALL